MLSRRITAVIGVLLLLLGVSSLLLLWQDQRAAENVDQTFTQGGISEEESGCLNVIQEVTLTKRVMTEKESQTLRVVLSNPNGGGVCNTAVRLAALDFELAPPATERVVTLEPGGNPVTLLWVLKPKETGSFEIAVSAGNMVEVLGIVVTNVLGLTAVQVQILSYISSFLGPMLTAPWWIEQWEKRKKTQKQTMEKTASRETAAKEI